MAASRPFSFGTFQVYEGRSAYNLQSAQITNYFDELSADMKGPATGLFFEVKAGLLMKIWTGQSF